MENYSTEKFHDNEIKELVKRKLDEYREWMIKVRRHLHMYPEVGDCEFQTTEYIKGLLDEMGIKTTRPLPTGVLGVLECDTAGEAAVTAAGKCIALRADIDALPMQEETGLEFCSKNAGVMHACGHDMHMAALLGTARIFSDPDVKKYLTAPVKFIFQPAEETDGGAARMIEAGCLEAPRAEYVLGYHVAPELLAGSIGTRHGYTHASSDMFDITVHGVKSHGAYPNEGIDAIVAASHIVTAIQSIVSRNVGAIDPCVITIGKFHAGTAGNIVCDTAELSGTMRTTSAAVRERAMTRLRETAERVAAALGASAEVGFRPGYIALHNNDAVVDLLNETAAEILGSENVITKEHPSMGVEDFAFYAAERPSAFFFVGTGYPDRKNYGIHHGKFEADEAALDVAVRLEVLTALRLMNQQISGSEN